MTPKWCSHKSIKSIWKGLFIRGLSISLCRITYSALFCLRMYLWQQKREIYSIIVHHSPYNNDHCHILSPLSKTHQLISYLLHTELCFIEIFRIWSVVGLIPVNLAYKRSPRSSSSPWRIWALKSAGKLANMNKKFAVNCKL